MAKYTTIAEIIDEKSKAAWDRKRWDEDGVTRLPQGFTLRKRGRDGSLYYREGEDVIELYFEMSGTDSQDILLSTDGLKQWILPTLRPIDVDKSRELRIATERWLLDNNIRALFV